MELRSANHISNQQCTDLDRILWEFMAPKRVDFEPNYLYKYGFSRELKIWMQT
jgi:hypothetical protein